MLENHGTCPPTCIPKSDVVRGVSKGVGRGGVYRVGCLCAERAVYHWVSPRRGIGRLAALGHCRAFPPTLDGLDPIKTVQCYHETSNPHLPSPRVLGFFEHLLTLEIRVDRVLAEQLVHMPATKLETSQVARCMTPVIQWVALYVSKRPTVRQRARDTPGCESKPP